MTTVPGAHLAMPPAQWISSVSRTELRPVMGRFEVFCTTQACPPPPASTTASSGRYRPRLDDVTQISLKRPAIAITLVEREARGAQINPEITLDTVISRRRPRAGQDRVPVTARRTRQACGASFPSPGGPTTLPTFNTCPSLSPSSRSPPSLTTAVSIQVPSRPSAPSRPSLPAKPAEPGSLGDPQGLQARAHQLLAVQLHHPCRGPGQCGVFFHSSA